MNPADGRVYGSLEYKDDAIGKGIRRTLDAGQVAPEDEKDRTGFYVAIFDVDRITRPDMDAEKDRVMTTVYIKEAVDDYFANGGERRTDGRAPVRLFGHRRRDLRAPVRQRRRSGDYLYVAYGVYGDTLRTDNDYQVLLAYDTKELEAFRAAALAGEVCIKAALRRPITSISSARATPRGEFRTWPMIPRRETAMPRFTKAKNLNTPIIRSL